MDDKITLSHGAGGRQMHRLINQIILKILGNTVSDLNDAAEVKNRSENNFPIALTTDSYTVKPIFFRGGDIGSLAVAGTVNDLIVTGANPIAMSLGLIIEEGLGLDDLKKIMRSIKATADQAAIEIITGDTKVVEKGAVDKIFINTAGVGELKWKYKQNSASIKPGDAVIINGTLADHGTAVMIDRGEFEIEANIESDACPLNTLLADIYEKNFNIKFVRDCTRGGMAATLNEIVDKKDFGILLNEVSIPVKKSVQTVCDILGLDPLYVANEGKVIIIVDGEQSEELLKFMKQYREAEDAKIIGEVSEENYGKIIMKTQIGGSRIVDMPSGEQLPRIC